MNQENMPNFDGTGPQGKGPKTGLGKGKCENTNYQAVNQRQSRGLGRRSGAGAGRTQGRGRGQV